jgi:hypothetical protein
VNFAPGESKRVQATRLADKFRISLDGFGEFYEGGSYQFEVNQMATLPTMRAM